MRWVAIVALGLAVLCEPTFAQPAQTADPAAAVAAAQFDKGRALMKEGKFADACAAFEQSRSIDPQLGTQYNLAGCYEKLGKLVSAWSIYRDLARRDSNAGRRDDSARRVQALEPRLARLTITVEPADAPGLVVTANGLDVTSLLGVATPTDLGDYALVARATGYVESQVLAKVRDEGKVTTVTVKLEPPRAVPAPAVQRAEPAPALGPEGRGMPARKKLAIGIAGGGAALVFGGLLAGSSASSRWKAAQTLCGPDVACADEDSLAKAKVDTDAARFRGDLSTVLVIAGGAAIAGGVVLWLTAPTPERSGVARIVPIATPTDVGLTIAGRF